MALGMSSRVSVTGNCTFGDVLPRVTSYIMGVNPAGKKEAIRRHLRPIFALIQWIILSPAIATILEGVVHDVEVGVCMDVGNVIKSFAQSAFCRTTPVKKVL